MTSRPPLPFARVNCKNEECEKYIDIINISPNDIATQQTLIYTCCRECLELYLKDAGYMIRNIPNYEKK
jgi:hypothetical protein